MRSLGSSSPKGAGKEEYRRDIVTSMTFDYAEVDRITQLVECEGEAALSDYDWEIYAAWSEHVEQAAHKIAPKLAVVLGSLRPTN